MPLILEEEGCRAQTGGLIRAMTQPSNPVVGGAMAFPTWESNSGHNNVPMAVNENGNGVSISSRHQGTPDTSYQHHAAGDSGSPGSVFSTTAVAEAKSMEEKGDDPDLMVALLLDMGYSEEDAQVAFVCRDIAACVEAIANKTDPAVLEAFRQQDIAHQQLLNWRHSTQATAAAHSAPGELQARLQSGSGGQYEWTTVGGRSQKPRGKWALAGMLPPDIATVLKRILDCGDLQEDQLDAPTIRKLLNVPPDRALEVVVGLEKCLAHRRHINQEGIKNLTGWIENGLKRVMALHPDANSGALSQLPASFEGLDPAVVTGLLSALRALKCDPQDVDSTTTGALKQWTLTRGLPATLTFLSDLEFHPRSNFIASVNGFICSAMKRFDPERALATQRNSHHSPGFVHTSAHGHYPPRSSGSSPDLYLHYHAGSQQHMTSDDDDTPHIQLPPGWWDSRPNYYRNQSRSSTPDTGQPHWTPAPSETKPAVRAAQLPAQNHFSQPRVQEAAHAPHPPPSVPAAVGISGGESYSLFSGANFTVPDLRAPSPLPPSQPPAPATNGDDDLKYILSQLEHKSHTNADSTKEQTHGMCILLTRGMGLNGGRDAGCVSS